VILLKKETSMNKRRFLHLRNLVQNYTLTKKHLEEFGDLIPEEKLKQAMLKQQRREEQINNLQKAILHEYDREAEVRNLVKNFLFAEGYIIQNKDRLPKHVLINLKKRQNYRKIQLENLIKKNDEE